MEDNRLSKVHILIQQKKYAEAERILKDLLATDSSNIEFLCLLAEVKLQQDKIDDARQIVDNAIAIAPEESVLFYIKTRISLQQDKYDDAEKHISQAIRMAPYDADYFALHAQIKLARKQYDKALELANKALELDAENLLGLNTRSTALLKLNNKEESFQTIEGALREDPNSAYTHANYGWGLLEKGDHKKALEHFKEALKNDPNFEYAQDGMLEAIKASNPIYRLFLKYAFFMSNLTSQYQWGVIIGFYVTFRVLRSLAKSNEALQPFLIPVLVVLGIVTFSTWVINPISNLFLRLNPFGQLLLDKKEKSSSTFVGISLLICLLGLVSYFALNDLKFLTIAAFGFAMMLPLGVMFSPSRYKNSLVIYAIAMAAIGLSAITLTFATGEVFNSISGVFVLGFIGFQWLANFLLIEEDKR